MIVRAAEYTQPTGRDKRTRRSRTERFTKFAASTPACIYSYFVSPVSAASATDMCASCTMGPVDGAASVWSDPPAAAQTASTWTRDQFAPYYARLLAHPPHESNGRAWLAIWTRRSAPLDVVNTGYTSATTVDIWGEARRE